MVRDGPTEEFFKRLAVGMVRLADHNLQALQITLGALVSCVSWEHYREEIVIMCCDLLQHVAKYTVERPLVQSIVHTLCRLAFRHPPHSTSARVDPLDLGTIDNLHTFIQDGDEEFIGDLMSFFPRVSWSEVPEGRILQVVLKIPNSRLSASSYAAIITMAGRARWSLMEGFDQKTLVDFVGRLPTDMVVERIATDLSARTGLMRLLLFLTFRPPSNTDPRPLWRILLHIPHRVPQLFSRDLLDYIETSPANFSHGYGSATYKKREEELWMKLFWSSRFFEMDYNQWSDFKDATVRSGRREPALLEQLEMLCFGYEVTPLRLDSAGMAYTEMSKLLDEVRSPRPPQGQPPQPPPPPPQLPLPPPPPQLPPPQLLPPPPPPPPVLRRNSLSGESFHSSLVRKTPPSPPLSLQERESPALINSDRLSYLSIHPSREFLGVASQSQLLPGNTVPPLLPEAGNNESADLPSLPYGMKRREEGYFEDRVNEPQQLQVPRTNPTRQNQNAAAGITRPYDSLSVALRDSPPVSSYDAYSSPSSRIMPAGPLYLSPGYDNRSRLHRRDQNHPYR